MSGVNFDGANRIIAFGASAGGPLALRELASGLDPAIPAAILIAQHSATDSPRALANLLESAGPLPAAYARDGQPLVGGLILIGPPDHHLLVQDGRVRVTRGPRENRSRPSIDVLFRSAAVAGGARTIGVLLTGLLDDGALGLVAVQRGGGVTIVQDPEEAAYPDMPESALATITVDYRLPLAEIAVVLNRLAFEPAPARTDPPPDLRLEVEIGLTAESSQPEREILGSPSNYSCPDCGGRLWQVNSGSPKHYLCEVGHAYNENALLDSQQREIERALYVALRTLEERARMLDRMAQEAEKKDRARSAEEFYDRSAETRYDADRIRRLLLQHREV